MSNYRRIYYNLFSQFYDGFVALHSSDSRGDLRTFLANNLPVTKAEVVLDLCTGTASLLPVLHQKVGPGGKVIGVDFSRGMLRVAREKTKPYDNIQLIEADICALPFRETAFDAVTCSYAFYELKGEAQDRVLKEVRRVLKPTGVFLMMEHDIPANALIRTLFYIRLASMGAKRAISILRHEKSFLEGYFPEVKKIVTPNGRTKIMICTN